MEPAVYALLFAFTGFVALKSASAWAPLCGLPFLMLAVLPFVATGGAPPEAERATSLVLETDWLPGARDDGNVHDLGQPADSTFCFLTGVTGKFMGGGESGAIFAEGGTWRIRVRDHQVGVRFKVSCVALPG